MSAPSAYEDEPQFIPRNPWARPGPVPDTRLDGLLLDGVPSLIPRQDSTTTTSSSSSTRSSCGPKDTTGPCERSTSSRDNTTLPITLGVIIPLTIAFLVMILLHRRNVKKQRKEDAEDRHKSLDFGLGPGQGKRKKGNKGPTGPEMSMRDAHNQTRRDRGLSLDMGVPNPYLLPPGLQHSRESLHSLSRSFNTGDDKYGRTNFIPDDGSIRSPSSLRKHGDDSSSYTGSSRPRFDYESSKTLVQTSTKSGPPTRRASLTSFKDPSPEPLPRKPIAPPKDNLLAPAPLDSGRDSFVSTTSSVGNANAFRKSNDYLGAFIRGGAVGTQRDAKDGSKMETDTRANEVKTEPPVKKSEVPPPAITKQEDSSKIQLPAQAQHQHSHPGGLPLNPREPKLPQLNFTELSDMTPPSAPEISITEHSKSPTPPSAAAPLQIHQGHSQNDAQIQERERSYYGQQGDSRNQTRENSYYDQHYRGSEQYSQQQHHSAQYDQQERQYQQYDQHRMPQDQNQQYDDEDDYYDPEEEYGIDYAAYEEDLGYDPRRLTMGMRPLPPDDPSENPEQRANRIRSFYKEYFDAPNGAQQQNYYDGSEYYDDYYYQDDYYHQRGHSSVGGRQRGHTFSNGSYQAGPRAFSSASGRYGQPYGRPGPRKPKKKMPPPKALNILPTPSKLKDDTFLLDQAVDFAPPTRAFLQRAGTPDSLSGGKRAYSPTVRAHIPLASSFDDLAAMPSPHQLRKSGTFTGLDFAAPAPRFRGQDSQSETGSIRSNRSGVSAMQIHNIRAGAYRLSRIPKEVAGTRDELSNSLRPQWDMNR